MEKITVKDFRNNLAYSLKRLPLVITSHGKPVGIIVSPSFFDYLTYLPEMGKDSYREGAVQESETPPSG